MTTLRNKSEVTVGIPRGSRLTITAAAVATAMVQRMNGDTEVAKQAFDNGDVVVLGEYFQDFSAKIVCFTGSVEFTVTQETDPVATLAVAQASADVVAIVAAMSHERIHLGSGVYLFAIADAPVDYTDGDPVATGDGFAGPGSLCVSVSEKATFQNTGTLAEPVWTEIGAVI